jgi:hypothetical protein
MRATSKRKQIQIVYPEKPRYIQQFRDFVEVPADTKFDDDKIIDVSRNGKRYVWADVLHELPSKNNHAGNTIILPVRIRHFKDLYWRAQ